MLQFCSNQLIYPVFVTYEKGEERLLRGCIGTFQIGYLESQLGQFAIIAANDNRFPSVSADELEDLTCMITLMHSFKKKKNVFDWEVGTHGVELIFTWQGEQYCATYLPQIIKQNGWTKERTIDELIVKSGCKESYETVKDVLEIETYEGHIKRISFEEYKKVRSVDKPEWF